MSWRERDTGGSSSSSTESEIGQLMLYLVRAHVRRFKVTRKKSSQFSPILGLYMKEMKVSVLHTDETF